MMFILASVPESFQTMVTALAAGTENTPPLADVKEKIRGEEMRQKHMSDAALATADDEGRKAFLTRRHGGNQKRIRYDPRQKSDKTFKCHYCRRPGHFKRDCPVLKKKEEAAAKHADEGTTTDVDGDDKLCVAVDHISCTANAEDRESAWLVDSGATCHNIMCNRKEQFSDLRKLSTPQKVSFGDGRTICLVPLPLPISERLRSSQVKAVRCWMTSKE